MHWHAGSGWPGLVLYLLTNTRVVLPDPGPGLQLNVVLVPLDQLLPQVFTVLLMPHTLELVYLLVFFYPRHYLLACVSVHFENFRPDEIIDLLRRVLVYQVPDLEVGLFSGRWVLKCVGTLQC